MKQYSFSFFFPTQPGGRQEHTERSQGSNPGVAFARAWRQLKRNPKYRGRKGLNTMRVGVTTIGEVRYNPNGNGLEISAGDEQDPT